MSESEALRRVREAGETEATSLDLSGLNLTSLPREIGNLAKLRWLNLGGNRLASLPKEIGNLANLDMLNLCGNQLTSLPREIADLENLKVLRVDGRLLMPLPFKLGMHASTRILMVTDDCRLIYWTDLRELQNYLRNRTTLAISRTNTLEIDELGDASVTADCAALNTVVVIESTTAGVQAASSNADCTEPLCSVADHDVEFYPVGQGLFYCGVILESIGSCAFTYVFDCGAQHRGKKLEQNVFACLERTSNHIDLLVLSHLHWDHVSGIRMLAKNSVVERVVLPYLYPSERLYVAAESLNDPGFQDDSGGQWYPEFLMRPARFLKEELGVKNVSFVRGGDSDSSEEQREQHIDGPVEGPWRGSPLPKAAVDKIVEAEAVSGDEVDPNAFFDSQSVAGHGRWVFSFFNRDVDPNKFRRFQASFQSIQGTSTLDGLLSDDTALKQIRHAYEGLFSAAKLNDTSLALCCRRLPEMGSTYHKVFTHGLSPSSCSGRPCLTRTEEPLSPAFLLTGDLPVNQVWSSFVRKFGIGAHKHPILPLVYQVPHHGSKENWNSAQRDSFADAVFVISARTVNHYGHPHPDVLRSLLSENRPTFWVTEHRPFMHRLQLRSRVSPPLR